MFMTVLCQAGGGPARQHSADVTVTVRAAGVPVREERPVHQGGLGTLATQMHWGLRAGVWILEPPFSLLALLGTDFI